MGEPEQRFSSTCSRTETTLLAWATMCGSCTLPDQSPLLAPTALVNNDLRVRTSAPILLFFILRGVAKHDCLLSDKLQRRKVFVIVSSLIMMVGLLLYAFFPTWSVVVIATVILGIGYGIFLSVGLALASQVLPTAANRGKDIGLINTALFLPMIFSPVLAGITLSTLHSYLALFLLLAVASLIAALLIFPIKTVR